MIHLLLPDQIEELRALEENVAAASDFDTGCRLLVTRLALILGVPVAVIGERRGERAVLAQSGDAPASDVLHSPPAASVDLVGTTLSSERGAWTRVAIPHPPEPALMLTFAGDWTLSQPVWDSVAERLAIILGQLQRRPRLSANAASWAFARRVTRIADRPRLHQMIVDTFARTVGAEKASLATFDAPQSALAITATYGYPEILVKHLRFRPGSGIIDRVFRTRRPLRVENIRELRDAPHPRLRYRTSSFISLPLIASDDVLGVVSVTDRQDGRPFDRGDLKALRGLSAIAALALDRARAVDDAIGSARVAAIDPLTSLFNRRQFLHRLDEEVERARRQQSPLAVMMVDVDNFKQLNDRLGHLAGDAVLRLISDVLRRSVRVFDVCARYGGDEFAILMPGSGPESSTQIADRIRDGIEDTRPAGGPWADDLRITVSIGIASFLAANGEELVGRADQALYMAKRAGRNRVIFSGASEG
jgi:diguanylate cyclase (GGDEF)-like protein